LWLSRASHPVPKTQDVAADVEAQIVNHVALHNATNRVDVTKHLESIIIALFSAAHLLSLDLSREVPIYMIIFWQLGKVNYLSVLLVSFTARSALK
jgi:hypothetical protein